jgi:hypothetical protein
LLKQKQAKYNADNKETVKKKKTKYNEENKEKIRQNQAKYNAENKKKLRQKKAEYNEKNQEAIKAKQSCYNKKNRGKINQKQETYNQKNAQTIAKKERKRKDIKKSPLFDFLSDISEGPTSPCLCCHRSLFSNGVVKTTKKELESSIGPDLYKRAIVEPESINSKEHIFICLNCNIILHKGKRPTISACNGLLLDPIPEELLLTDLEQQLIAKRLLFLKVYALPKSRMPAMKDRLINVPLEDSDIAQTIQTLPRSIESAGLVAVKLKRMKKLKTSHISALIRPGILHKAIQKLKDLGHSEYQFDLPAEEICNLELSSSEEESEDEGEDESTDKGIHQSELYNGSTCLVHNNLESNMIFNTENETQSFKRGNQTFEIAPGEGKVPTNIMSEENIDVKAFPVLFPTGQYGCDHSRDPKLSKQKYFIQRILNVDSRFRENTSYLFAAQHIVEREQLEKNINLVVQRGQLRQGTNGEHIVANKDHYAAFQKIRGSPKYFQTARNELLARVAQLGPFQLFFTLSCGEMRWPEVIATLLSQQGHLVKCINQEEQLYTVNQLPLDEFLEKKAISTHNLFRDNIVTVTRMFDHRVKKFVQHVIKSKKSSIPADCFNYRVEFQMRGMAHVHGVLWLEESTILQYREPFTQLYDSEKIPELIDQLMTCKLPEKNTKLRKIVEEVQFHHHTKSCRKYNNNCRFNYPRYPSKKTIIAKPFPDTMDQDEKQKKLETQRGILKRVKDILENGVMTEDMSIDDLVEKAGVSIHEYENALSVSERGIIVVLKRKVAERFINKYSPEWLLAWNANIDIQFCFDPYAVTTYICDYYGKDDTGMTELLKAALKSVQGGTQNEVLNALKKTYLTHRQIGACEAVYRLLPNLHMKDANVTCIFVSTGFIENRSIFLEKAIDEELEQEHKDEESDPVKLVQIEGKPGYYKQRISIHERYSKRPCALEDVCLAQFAIMYKITPYQRKKIIMKNFSSEAKGSFVIYLTGEYLPLEIRFPEMQVTPMQLRGRPAILRIHESKKKKEQHEFYFSELLLFHPWRDEKTDLHRHDPTQCKQLYKENFSQIYERRQLTFPFLDAIEEAQARLEETSLEDIRPLHVGETLDSVGEQENEDGKIEGDFISEEHAGLHPGELDNIHIETPTSSDFPQFKVVSVNQEEMMTLTRQLVPEQMIVLDAIIGYCKKTARAQINGGPRIEPIRILLHGGAGSGKSNVIRICSSWAEKILRKAGDHPNKPRVLLTAPTGTAASIIGGTTLHSAFNFSFGDDLKPLSDKKLDELRCALSDVKLIIVDEISMMRSDLLYQLHLRLCEIYQNNHLFGNRAIMLVGDLLQLKPVRGRYIFEQPKCSHYQPYHAVSPLWDEFEVYTLIHNHRQGQEKQWAETLNHFREGIVLKKDLEMLQPKLISSKEATQKIFASHLFFTNKEVDEHNMWMLNTLQTKLYSISAAISLPYGCKARVDKTGRIDQTAFMSQLNIKTGARVMLIHNINIVDGLTNGAMGQILDIKKCSSGNVSCLIIKFDNEDIGVEQRRKYPDLAIAYSKDKGTPLFREQVQYQLPRGKGGGRQHTATGKIFQFPVRLAWAVTAHKVQGQTFKKGSTLVVHWHKKLAHGMAYVMLGRCESPNDLFITDSFDPNGIKCDEKAKEMSLSLQMKDRHQQEKWTKTSGLHLMLCNIRSLKDHWKDLANIPHTKDCDIICLTETWLSHGEDFKNFESHPINLLASHGNGRGRGCGVFFKDLPYEKKVTIKESYQVVEFTIFDINFILVYRCNGYSTAEFLNFLEATLTSTKTVVLGDFNIQAGSNKRLANMTSTRGLVQQVEEATHDGAHILDHIYTSKDVNCVVSLSSVFFSDHDILSLHIKV